MSPLREDVLVFPVTLYVTVPLPLPELPDVIVTHDRLSDADHETLAVTPIVWPLADPEPCERLAGVSEIRGVLPIV